MPDFSMESGLINYKYSIDTRYDLIKYRQSSFNVIMVGTLFKCTKQ